MENMYFVLPLQVQEFSFGYKSQQQVIVPNTVGRSSSSLVFNKKHLVFEREQQSIFLHVNLLISSFIYYWVLRAKDKTAQKTGVDRVDWYEDINRETRAEIIRQWIVWMEINQQLLLYCFIT